MSVGALIAMGASCDLMIDKFPIPVRNLKRGLTRDQHFAPGTIVRIQVVLGNVGQNGDLRSKLVLVQRFELPAR